MKPFWLSWYAAGPFSWDGPWWIAGVLCFVNSELDREYIVAAVMADDVEHAKRQLTEAHDIKGLKIEWRFHGEKPADWDPFCGRWPRGEWMKWPWPVPAEVP